MNQEETQVALREQKIQFIAQKGEMEMALENLDVFNVIKHFIYKTGLGMLGIGGYIILFIFFGLVIIVIREFFNKIKIYW